MPPGFRAGLEPLRQLVPGVVIHLLESERDPLLIRINAEDHDLDLFALAHDLGRMLYPPGPTHVGDMDEPVDPRLYLDERAEGCEIPHHSSDLRPRRILRRKGQPRILLGLLHTERDLLLLFIDPQHNALKLVVDRRQL